MPLQQENSERPRGKSKLAEVWTFLTEVRRELESVTWPEWKEVRSTTVIVLLVVAAISAYVFGVDALCDYFIEHMLRRQH